MKSILPITTVSMVIVILWYGFSVILNSTWTKDQASRAGVEVTFSEILKDTMVQQRPLLPAPHQVVIELWETTANKKITSKRSLVYHGWITLSATLLGFVIGTGLGILLAIGIVHNKAMDYGVMPWIIASQTVPILALAPMIIVVLYSIGLSGLVPKAIISAYLSFFPVSVGMVAGFRCPDPTQMDLLKTYAAKKSQLFWKLMVPISMPYLFTSLKIGVAASLVGAIVGELPTGAVAGLGARLLAGSYYGQTVQIWSALIGSAILAATLVGLIGLIQKFTLDRMGLAR
ncbi:MAG: ABC transporter permease [Rhodobacteraceae bacterium]|nr:ABC transporter permease [Paracoccaceae bacterium]MCY4250692.1 ABC transporter permease [Paracoccaceae bacterium]MCY4309412.1 ABC transporter permease [Paracoccaceae bacterium]